MNARQELAAKVRATILDTIERCPVSVMPEEGTISLVDNGTKRFFGERRTAATFSGGRWVRANGNPLPFEPTYWAKWRFPPAKDKG